MAGGGVIRTLVSLLFKAEGVDKTTAGINKLTRAQEKHTDAVEISTKKETRLANESTNTARAFASQASGLGGLVAAYAGAAATTFALQQAFSALSAAARSEAVVTGITSLAQSLGQDGPKIIATIKEITRGQLSLTEAAQNTGIALSAGLTGEQFNELADIATKASKVLGRDLTDSLQRLVRGVGKLEPELLDELGIFTRIDPAVERYAIKLGVAASSLTNFERRQAFANAVIEEGTNKYKNVDTAVSDSSQNLNRLVANISDLALKIGQVVTTVLDPIVTFFNNDITKLSALVAVLGSLIFSKLNQITREGIESLNERISQFGAKATTSLTKGIKEYASAVGKAQTALQELGTANSFVGGAAKTKPLRDALAVIRAGDIAPTDIKKSQQLILDQIIKEREAATKAQESANRATQRIQEARKAGKSESDLVNQAKGLASYTAKASAAEARAKSLENLNAELGLAFDSAGAKAAGTARAVGILTNAFRLLTVVLGGLVRIISFFSIAFAVLETLGSVFESLTGVASPFGRVVAFISEKVFNFTENLKLNRQANEALISTFIKEDEALKKNASSVDIYNAALSRAKTTIADVNSFVADALKIEGRTESITTGRLETRYRSQASVRLRLFVAEAKSQRELASQLSEKGLKPTGFFDNFFSISRQSLDKQELAKTIEERSDLDREAAKNRILIETFNYDYLLRLTQSYNQKILEYREELSKAKTAKDREELSTTIDILENSKEEYLSYYKELIKGSETVLERVIEDTRTLQKELSKQLGIGIAEITKLVREGTARATGKRVLFTFKDLFGNDVTQITGDIKTIEKEGLTPLQRAIVNTGNSSLKLKDLLEGGTVGGELLSGFIASIEKDIKNVENAAKGASTTSPFTKFLVEAKVTLEFFKDLRTELVFLDKNAKDVSEGFTGAIQAATTFIRTGTVSTQGTIATTSEEKQANQLAFLSTVISSTKTLTDLEKEREAILAKRKESFISQKDKVSLDRDLTIINSQIQNTSNAYKALTGEAANFATAMEQVRLTEERRTIELTNQLTILKAQANATDISQSIEVISIIQRNLTEVEKTEQDIAATRREANIANIEAQKSLIELSRTRLELDKNLLSAQQQYEDAVSEARKKRISEGAEVRAAILQGQRDLLAEFGGAGGAEAVRELQFKVDIGNLKSELDKARVDLTNALNNNAEAIANKDTKAAEARVRAGELDRAAFEARTRSEEIRIGTEERNRERDLADRERLALLQLDQAEAQLSVAKTQIEAETRLRELDQNLLKVRYDQLRLQSEIFTKHENGIAETFAKDQAFRATQLKDPKLKPDSKEFKAEVDRLTGVFRSGVSKAIEIPKDALASLEAQKLISREIEELRLSGAVKTFKAAVDRYEQEENFIAIQRQSSRERTQADVDLLDARNKAEDFRLRSAQETARAENIIAQIARNTAEIKSWSSQDEVAASILVKEANLEILQIKEKITLETQAAITSALGNEAVRVEMQRLDEILKQNEGYKLQNELTRLQNQLSEEQLKRETEISKLRFDAELANAQTDFAQKQIDLQKTILNNQIDLNNKRKEEVQVQEQLRTLELERRKLAIDIAEQAKVSVLEGERRIKQRFTALPDLGRNEEIEITANLVKAESNLAKAVTDYEEVSSKTLEAANIDIDNSNRRLSIAKLEEKAVKDKITADIKSIEAEKNIRLAEINDQKALLDRRLEIDTEKTALDIRNIRIQEEISKRDLNIRIKTLEIQENIFNKHVDGLAEVFARFEAENINKNLEAGEPRVDVSSLKEKYLPVLQRGRIINEEILNLVSQQRDAITDAATAQIQGLTESANSARRIYDLSANRLAREISNTEQLAELKIDTARTVGNIESRRATTAVNIAERDVSLSETSANLSKDRLNLEKARALQAKQAAQLNRDLAEIEAQITKEIKQQTEQRLDGPEFIRAERQRLDQILAQNKAYELQNELLAIQNLTTESQLKREIALNNQRFGIERAAALAENANKKLELDKTRLDIQVQANESRKQELQLQQQLRDVELERLKFAIDRREREQLGPLERQQELTQRFAGFGDEVSNLQRQIQVDIVKQEAALARAAADYQNSASKNVKAAEIDIESARLKLRVAEIDKNLTEAKAKQESARIEAERALRQSEINSQEAAARERLDADKKQLEINRTSIQTQKEFADREFEVRLETLKIQAKIFDEHIQGLAAIFARFEYNLDPSKFVEATSSPEDILKSLTDRYTEGLSQTQQVNRVVQDLIEKQRNATQRGYDLQLQGISATEASLNRQFGITQEGFKQQKEQTDELAGIRQKGINLTARAEGERAQANIALATEGLKTAQLSRAVAEGQLSLEQARNLEEVKRQEEQLQFLKKIAELSNNAPFLALSDSIGIFKKTTGEFITTLATDVINGTKSAKDAFKSFLLSLATEIQKAIVKRTITDPIVTAIGSVTDKALLSLVNFSKATPTPSSQIMANPISGAEPLFTPAIGGLVKRMAVGGGVDGGRDSVPALLEPGEFVIRRPAAQAIGVDNLEVLNALAPNASPEDRNRGSSVSPSFVDLPTFFEGMMRGLGYMGAAMIPGSSAISALSSILTDGKMQSIAEMIPMSDKLAQEISDYTTQLSSFYGNQVTSGAMTASMAQTAAINDLNTVGRLGEVLASIDAANIVSSFPTASAEQSFGSIPDTTPSMADADTAASYAIGGSVRDRVPALLEPGEFIIRRPAAMAIGGAVLNQMNANGQLPVGNVSVNVINQGTPQAVQGQPTVTRQGENIIIDLVVKDIKNNGPIRQTLKGMR